MRVKGVFFSKTNAPVSRLSEFGRNKCSGCHLSVRFGRTPMPRTQSDRHFKSRTIYLFSIGIARFHRTEKKVREVDVYRYFGVFLIFFLSFYLVTVFISPLIKNVISLILNVCPITHVSNIILSTLY